MPTDSNFGSRIATLTFDTTSFGTYGFLALAGRDFDSYVLYNEAFILMQPLSAKSVESPEASDRASVSLMERKRGFGQEGG